jgi:hypothetical protein
MITNDPFRVDPAMPAHAYTSYQIVAPLATHFRPATCEETRCDKYLAGWQLRKENLDAQMLHIATHSGRRFREVQIAQGETWLLFEAGQPCFKASEHRIRIERPEFYYRRPGDWRGNPTGERPYLHQRADFWVEDFAEHQDKLITAINQG